MIVHLGVVLIAVAFAASAAYSHQSDHVLTPGQSATISGHRIVYISSSTEVQPQRRSDIARVQVDGGKVYTPALRQYTAAGQVVGSPAVHTTLKDDVYLTLLAAPTHTGGAVTIRVIVEPLVFWLWVGGGVIFVGAFLSAFPGRRRNPIDPVSAPLAAPVVAGGAPPPDADPDLVGAGDLS
jgi:cytochrome c-type biogenesis protein CcmF